MASTPKNRKRIRPSRRMKAVDRAAKLGIDVTLLEENLRLTPEERLVRAARFHRSASRLTEAIARADER